MSHPTNHHNVFATGIGFIAILLWATLALFTSLTNDKNGNGIPPFQLLFLSFTIGATVNVAWLTATGKFSKAAFTAPRNAWLLSVGGLFFYHFFYFNALARAPAVEAGLIAYLWPLLIVLFSALLPSERLRWYHITGGFVAFLGAAALIVLKGEAGFTFEAQYTAGYVFAVACALTWSLYSVFNRQFAEVPSSATVGFCYLVAVLGLISHLVTESWTTPTLRQWVGIFGLGIGPVGLAFFVWDYGTKRGNIQMLGTLSYFAPLLSTVLLIVFAGAPVTTGVIIGCLGIMLGALIAVLPAKLAKHRA